MLKIPLNSMTFEVMFGGGEGDDVHPLPGFKPDILDSDCSKH